MAQLHMISALARTRKLQVGELWRQLGLAFANRASVRHAESHNCPLFLTTAIVFFRIQDTGPASKGLIDTFKQGGFPSSVESGQDEVWNRLNSVTIKR